MSLAPRALSDAALIRTISEIASVERQATASLIAHLAELEARNLHLASGFRSIFGYCRHVLHCSEHEAYNRMEVVHAARRFPVILPLLAEGLLHLTAVRLLAPHLRDEDHLALLGGALHRSRRDVLKLIARWFPSAEVPSSLRRLPSSAATIHGPWPGEAAAARPSPAPPHASGGTPPPQPSAPAKPAISPLSAARYRLQVTIDDNAHDDLRALQDLMRREIPSGDPAAIVARGLKLLRRETEKKACSATSRPGPAREPAPATRDIPAHVERAVWDRDQGQCSFHGHGRRCEERSFLEYHHLTPWIVGGAPSVENIALRCSAHNKYESAVYFAPIRAAREERESALGPVP